MAEICKLVYAIIFLSLFLVATNVEGKSFLTFSNFLIYSEHNILSHLSYIILFSFLITARKRYRCFSDSDCIKSMFCRRPKVQTCMYRALCKCVVPVFEKQWCTHMILYFVSYLILHTKALLEYFISCNLVIMSLPNNLIFSNFKNIVIMDLYYMLMLMVM
jgi:hypothetical protein